jgi:serine/threonine protein kinase/dipeptidyl aminopeptidase/acylaminoacyl peptidase
MKRESRRQAEQPSRSEDSTVPQLASGAQLGPYRIEEPLGAGGMGEVYRASDTRLHRTVAIKVLPGDKFPDPELKRRFLQEARAASALNHPHIVALYDIGHDGGRDFLVLEYVPGKTLAQLTLKKRLPPEEAVELTAQIASALAAAHAAGIVHRDIKPANVIVTPESQAKVLDFGLAKLESPGQTGAGQESAHTLPGVLMGTVAYMSPEQAAGREVDHHTDIFSLGVVLYELLAGRRPFQGKSPMEILHAIIHDPAPQLSAADSRVPPEIDEIAAKALAKDPGQRYHHAGDFELDLRRFKDAWESKTLPSMRAAPPLKRVSWPYLKVAGMVLALALVALVWRLWQQDYFWKNPLAPARIMRLTDFEGDEMDAAISSDGKFVVFLSDRDGPIDAWMTQVGGGTFVNLTKGQFPDLLNDIARGVGFSADAAHVWVRGELRGLWLIPAMGGIPRRFITATNVAWSPDGASIAYFVGESGDPILLADRNGSNARQIFIAKPGEHCHYPTWSPDGRFIYFVRGGARLAEADVWRVPVNGGKGEQITRHDSQVRYPTLIDARTLLYSAKAEDGSGHSLYVMDVDRRVPHRMNFGVEQYRSVSASFAGPNGRPRLVATVANPSGHLWSVPITAGIASEAQARRLTLPTVRAVAPHFGPDYLLYLSSTGGDDGIWKLKEGAALELWKPSEGPLAVPPAISQDGRQICLVVRTERRGAVFVMTADGTNLRPVGESLDVRGTPSWSPDGKWIAASADDGTGLKLFKIPVSGGSPMALVNGPALNPMWSPDGRFILYRLNVDRNNVRAVTPEGKAYPIEVPPLRTRGGANDPYHFLPGGKDIVVLHGQYRQENFWLVNLATGRTRQLTDLKPGFSISTFDVSPDGKQIVFDRVRQNADIVMIDLGP